MKGKAHCVFCTTPEKIKRFNNITLTYIGSEMRMILSSDDRGEPEELLCLEAVQLDVLSAKTIDLEGFVCMDEEKQAFYKCSVIFVPDFADKEAA